MADPDDAEAKVDNNKFTHTVVTNNIPAIVDLSFACIVGAKALAASAAAVLAAAATL